MGQLAQKLFIKHSSLIKILFFTFLFFILSFGRAFSVVHLKINSLPVFITEIFLLVSLPLVILNKKELLKIPRLFLVVSFVYFLFGFFYSLWGFLGKNFFALRDSAVLCGYMLFLPVAFICFSRIKSVKVFIIIIVSANIVSLLVGRILIFGDNQSWFYGLVYHSKVFQIGMVYGFICAFLFVFYNYLKNKIARLFVLGLAAVNLYMLVIFGVRSLWIAVFCLAIFQMLILGFRVMIKVYFKFFVAFIIIGSVLFCIDFVVFKSPQLDVLTGKSRGLVCFLVKLSGKQNNSVGAISKSVFLDESGGVVLRRKSERTGYDNIVWRGKIWKQTIEFASGSYLFGKGFGNYPEYDIWGYREPISAFEDSGVIPAHNHFLTIFYKMGLSGFGIFLFINIYVFYYTIKYLKECHLQFIRNVLAGTLGALVFWHAEAMFFDVIDSPPTSILLWIFIGLIFATVNLDKNIKKGEVV
jgi:MFS family permease